MQEIIRFRACLEPAHKKETPGRHKEGTLGLCGKHLLR